MIVQDVKTCGSVIFPQKSSRVFADFNNNIGACSSDTVQISNKTEKKEKISYGKTALVLAASFAAGILIPYAAGALFRMINRGRRILPEKIDFKVSETLDDAVKFGREVLGIKSYKGFTQADTDVVNRINEGLVRVNNAAKGRAPMPKEIVFELLKNDWSGQMSGGGVMGIDSRRVNQIKDSCSLWETIKSLVSAKGDKGKTYLIQKFGEKKANIILNSKPHTFYTDVENFCRSGSNVHDVSGGMFSIVSHECGHNVHHKNIGFLYYLLDKKAGFLDCLLDPIEAFQARKLRKLFKNSQNIAAKVSEYAKTSPLEFIAECYAKMVDGIKLDDDVMQLYKKLGGAVI